MAFNNRALTVPQRFGICLILLHHFCVANNVGEHDGSKESDVIIFCDNNCSQ
jgi:hypothetical protein